MWRRNKEWAKFPRVSHTMIVWRTVKRDLTIAAGDTLYRSYLTTVPGHYAKIKAKHKRRFGPCLVQGHVPSDWRWSTFHQRVRGGFELRHYCTNAYYIPTESYVGEIWTYFPVNWGKMSREFFRARLPRCARQGYLRGGSEKWRNAQSKR